MIKKVNHFQLTMECFTVLWHVQKAVGETAVQEILEYNGGYKIILDGMRKYASGSYDEFVPFALGTEVITCFGVCCSRVFSELFLVFTPRRHLLNGIGTELLSRKPSNLLALPEGDYGNFMRHAPSQ